jgi:hypothetical protein
MRQKPISTGGTKVGKTSVAFQARQFQQPEAGPCRTLSVAERTEVEQRLRAEGLLRDATADELQMIIKLQHASSNNVWACDKRRFSARRKLGRDVRPTARAVLADERLKEKVAVVLVETQVTSGCSSRPFVGTGVNA